MYIYSHLRVPLLWLKSEIIFILLYKKKFWDQYGPSCSPVVMFGSIGPVQVGQSIRLFGSVFGENRKTENQIMTIIKTEPKPISVGNRTEITEIFRFGFGFNRKNRNLFILY